MFVGHFTLGDGTRFSERAPEDLSCRHLSDVMNCFSLVCSHFCSISSSFSSSKKKKAQYFGKFGLLRRVRWEDGNHSHVVLNTTTRLRIYWTNWYMISSLGNKVQPKAWPLPNFKHVPWAAKTMIKTLILLQLLHHLLTEGCCSIFPTKAHLSFMMY